MGISSEVMKILKPTAFIGALLVALRILGGVINNLIPWTWLTSFFSIMRWGLGLLDFMWDTDTLIIVIGLVLAINVAYWAFKGVLAVINYFRTER